MIPTERIQRLIDPAFVAALDSRPVDELRAMKAECNDVENALSYRRRLAQARIEILEAEHDRRVRGGTVEDMVKDLDKQKETREQIFSQELSSHKDRGRLLEEKFKEAMKRADKDKDKVYRNPLDLD